MDKNNMRLHIIVSKLAACLFFLLLNFSSFAQGKIEMADVMRSNGKIYVVVAVCLTILIGLFLYIFSLDRKIRRMEKDNK